MLEIGLISALLLGAPNFDRGRDSIAAEVSELAKQDPGPSEQVLLRPNVDWTGFSNAKIGPVKFDLDPKFYRRRYDLRIRQWVDESLEDSDKKHLSKVLTRELNRELKPTGSSPAGEVLYIEPVITMVMWSYPGTVLSRRPMLLSDSVQSGSAAVRFNLRRNGPEGELVGSILDHWQSTLRDQVPRNATWLDAERGFHIMTERLANRFTSLGVATWVPNG